MARIDVPDGSGLERERLLMMQLDIAMGMGAYSAAIYEKTSLPPRVREVARLRIAAANGCPVCLNTRSAHATEDGFDEATVEAVVACDLGGVHTLGDLDERERLAGEFADRFASRGDFLFQFHLRFGRIVHAEAYQRAEKHTEVRRKQYWTDARLPYFVGHGSRFN